MVLGGETTRENRENEHSTSVEIIGPNGDPNCFYVNLKAIGLIFAALRNVSAIGCS